LRALRFRADIIRERKRLRHMPMDPEDLSPRIETPEFALGQDLSAFSEHELAARIAAMEVEIARCREAITSRQATKNAASAFFKPS
jgi:uncharacterized small protein (DUF1192 family)